MTAQSRAGRRSSSAKRPGHPEPREPASGDDASCGPRLSDIGGSASDAWNNVLANQAVATAWVGNSDEEQRKRQTQAIVAALIGYHPRDELEGMMIAQMLAAHNAAMECYRRAMHPEQTFASRTENLNHAGKLSRTCATLVEALNRHRGKGQQKVTVEHVHVHAGGQAVVGMVETRGGAGPQEGGQPDARQLAHAPEPPLWREDPERDAVPAGSDDERALPDARRPVPGRS